MANIIQLFRSFTSRLHPLLQLPPQQTTLRLYASRNPLERRTAKELYDALTGGKGGRKGRGQKWDRVEWVQLPKKIPLGRGKKGQRWPGLSYPLPSTDTTGPSLSAQKKFLAPVELSEGTEQESMNDLGVINVSDLKGEYRTRRGLHEMNWSRKGWSGRTWKGRYVGIPEDSDGTPLPDFHSVILDMYRARWKCAMGSQFAIQTSVIVGNGKGMIGLGVARTKDMRGCIRRAKNRAVQQLRCIPICEGHTIFHNIKSKCVRTRVFMERKERGYGLRCNPKLQAVMQLIGIKDIRIKQLGNTHVGHLVRATLNGLLRQETYESLANETGKFVVQYRTEYSGRPLVVGVPSSTDESFLVWLKEHQMLHSDLEQKLFKNKSN